MRILSIILLFLTVAVLVVMYRVYEPSVRPDTIAIDRILKDLAEYGTNHQLSANSTYISSPERIVRALGMGFDVRGPLSQTQLRSLLIDMGQHLIASINSSEDIRVFLLHYPFDHTNINLQIFVRSAKGDLILSPNISRVGIRKGRVYFEKWRYEAGMPRIESHIDESYEEALEAAQISQKVFSNSVASSHASAFDARKDGS